MKLESELPLLMLFVDASDALEKEDPQTIKTLEIEEANLLTMSLMEQVSRTTSLSPKPETLSQWDHSCTSLIVIELEQKHSLPNTLGTSC